MFYTYYMFVSVLGVSHMYKNILYIKFFFLLFCVWLSLALSSLVFPFSLSIINNLCDVTVFAALV